MVYRVLIGFIPMILIALVFTGTIPLGGIIPTQEYRSSAVRAADAKKAKEADATGRPDQTRRGGGEMPSVGEAFRMHTEISGDIARMEREKRDGTFSEVSPTPKRPAGWKPRPGGWGPQD
jgi:hypothetical protein